ncbi:MAG: hypothetical protein K2M83_04425 [Muribaculaceae bacterium]|nr:hypothetical protein [Muribaculaceae bacterium]
MKKNRKKRSQWQDLLRVLRNNEAYLRVLNIREIHRKRVLREFIEWDYQENKKEYEREFRKEWRRQMREMDGPVKYDTSVFPPVPIRP